MIAEVIRRALDSRIGDILTCLPGKIVTYGDATQTADVQPMITRPLPTDEEETTHETLPIIPGVRVIFPRASGCWVKFPLAPGDGVLLVFSTWSFGQWLESGEVSDPGDLRQHHLANAFCIPGIEHNANPLPSDPSLVIEGPEIKLGKDAAEYVAKANLVLDNLTKVKDTITNWVPVPNDGGAALKTAFTALFLEPWPFSVAADKVKVE